MSSKEKSVEKPIEKISEEDRLSLELSKSNRKVALANAEKALAQNESAEVAYRYLVLQLFVKYGLNPVTDAMQEDGTIARGVGVQTGVT